MEERFVRNLVKMVKCATCGRRYSPVHANVLGHQDDLWFLSIACPVCKTQGLVAALVKEQAPAPVVEAAEQPEPRPTRPVGQDDVHEIREFLAAFDGDFIRLFRRGKEEGG